MRNNAFHSTYLADRAGHAGGANAMTVFAAGQKETLLTTLGIDPDKPSPLNA
jgi:hypothetical protein